jgi:hypothetical protein
MSNSDTPEFKPPKLQLDPTGSFMSRLEEDFDSTLLDFSELVLTSRTHRRFEVVNMHYLKPRLIDRVYIRPNQRLGLESLVRSCVQTCTVLFDEVIGSLDQETRQATQLLIGAPGFSYKVDNQNSGQFRESCLLGYTLYPEMAGFRDTLEVQEQKLLGTPVYETVSLALGFSLCRLHEVVVQAQTLPVVDVPDFVPSDW